MAEASAGAYGCAPTPQFGDGIARGSGAMALDRPDEIHPDVRDVECAGGHALRLRDTLPEGYLPLREVKDLSLLGRWLPLDDRMSPCLPLKVLSAMQRRRELGDPDADAWLELHARAYAGDPDAQRAFGRVCECGLHRASADLQRAFFWYYRAALQGDDEARKNAERLMRSTRISSATMAEPMLVYPGQWLITAQVSERLRSKTLFELAEDGSATGSLVGDGAAAECAGPAQSVIERGGTTSTGASPKNTVRYHGGWAYDGIGNVLTIIFEPTETRARRWRSDNWQIAIFGCGRGFLFGRDRRGVCHILKCAETGHATTSRTR
jgi:hypothetical protein